MQTPSIRTALFDIQDGIDWVLGRRNPLVPPRKLIHGIGSSLDVGETYLRYFREFAELQSNETVLDVGCGIGRMALPMTRYLRPPGWYEGFDIMRSNVTWCQRAITPRFPNFRFQHADVFNREYNPRGRLAGHEFRFPYPDGMFGFAYLTSVFTHLMPADAAHYLSEISRVLRPGGRCLATFFLMNVESKSQLLAGRGSVSLQHFYGPAWVSNPEIPEACVALDESFVAHAAEKAGLLIHRSYPGRWNGRETFTDSQDILLFIKK